MQYIHNPQDAAALMTSARSFGNYDLAAALADLIDNSINARARNIHVRCYFSEGDPIVRVVDDGEGMGREKLLAAMRPASTDPREERSPDDLGRFGWGMKSASFSQCTHLTVISRRSGRLSGAAWNLRDIDGWKMGVLSDDEILESASPEIRVADGTEVIWRNCDRLSENGSASPASFNDTVAHAGNRLALIFHKYLGGEVKGKPLTIRINGQALQPFDPFFRRHNATQPLPVERLRLGYGTVEIAPFILPHFSKLNLPEHERLAGEEGFLRNQGFYVYRNHRLIIHGTWFRLAKYGELSQLVRIGVDIPNSLDEIWKITIDKSDAQLPALLRSRLKQIVDGLRRKSSRVFRSKGGKIDQPGTIAVWSRYARNGEVRYQINRDHPLVVHLLSSGDQETRAAAAAALKAIEQAFPVAAFCSDASESADTIHQTEADPTRFLEMLEAAIPGMLIAAGDDLRKMVEMIHRTEPFSANRILVDSYLKEKGWTDA